MIHHLTHLQDLNTLGAAASHMQYNQWEGLTYKINAGVIGDKVNPIYNGIKSSTIPRQQAMKVCTYTI